MMLLDVQDLPTYKENREMSHTVGKYQAGYHDDFIAKKKCQNLQTAILSLVVV